MMRLGISWCWGATVLGLACMASAETDQPEGFRRHRPNQDQMKAAISAARESAKARHDARVLDVRRHYPGAALSNREVLDELRVHARRMAFLNRAKFVATTELEEPKRAKVIARVGKLTEVEGERHRKRMQTLRAGASADPSGSAPPALSAPPLAAPAAKAAKGSAP